MKQRSYPMRGFGTFASASQFCRAFDEGRQFFRFRTTTGQSLSLAQQRDLFRQRLDTFNALVLEA
jgi:putative transposase